MSMSLIYLTNHPKIDLNLNLWVPFQNKMKATLIFLFLIAQSMVFAASLSTLESINANNDHGLWLEQNFRSNITSKTIMRFHFEQRWAADYRQIYFHEYEYFFQHDIAQYLNKTLRKIFETIFIGPAYNFTRSIQKDTLGIFHWVWFRKPMLEMQLFSSLGKWTIRQRLRGEYIDYTRKHYKNFGTFRYRIEIFTPWKWTRWKINPYIWNEWFIRRDTYSLTHPTGLVGGWYENRFRIGLLANLFENVSSAVYWQWLSRKQIPGTHPGWFKTYQIGFLLDMSF